GSGPGCEYGCRSSPTRPSGPTATIGIQHLDSLEAQAFSASQQSQHTQHGKDTGSNPMYQLSRQTAGDTLAEQDSGGIGQHHAQGRAQYHQTEFLIFSSQGNGGDLGLV